MPAASLAELYNFEGNIEGALRLWLADNLVECEQSIQFETLPDDYTGVTMTTGAVTGHYNPSPAGGDTPGYDQYAAEFEFIVRTKRFDDGGDISEGLRSRHQELVALVRQVVSLSQAKGSALETYLEYYAIQFFRPSGTSHSVDGIYDETTLTFDSQFSILPTAWV